MELATDFEKVKYVVQDFQAKYIEQNRTNNLSWKYLSYHAEYCMLLAEVLRLRASGKTGASIKKAEELKQYLCQTEMETHRVFDARNAFALKVFGQLLE